MYVGSRASHLEFFSMFASVLRFPSSSFLLLSATFSHLFPTITAILQNLSLKMTAQPKSFNGTKKSRLTWVNWHQKHSHSPHSITISMTVAPVFSLGLCFVCSFVLFDLFVCPHSFMFP